MALDNGWQPLSKPPRREGAGAFVVTPFTRLARTHAAAVAGDTLIALALANSLFFDIDPNAARSKVALYLALTMAPFAVVAPLIGPALDRMRGGRRFMVIGANALRAVLCVLMIGDLDSLLLFPEAFAVLVLAKSYHVAKSAIVPTVVRSDDELVEANSRLSFLSGVIAFAAAVPGAWLVSTLAGQPGRAGAGGRRVRRGRRARASRCRPPRSRPTTRPRPSATSCAAAASSWRRRPWACCAASSGSSPS